MEITTDFKDKEKVLSSAHSIMKENNLLALSTINNDKPLTCNIFYAEDKNFNLYFWSDLDSAHCKNIKENSNVSIIITNTKQKWGSKLKGLQASGKSNILNKIETLEYGKIYIKKYPKILHLLKSPVDFLKKFKESGLFKIELEKIKILDEKVFGKEEYVKLSIKR